MKVDYKELFKIRQKELSVCYKFSTGDFGPDSDLWFIPITLNSRYFFIDFDITNGMFSISTAPVSCIRNLITITSQYSYCKPINHIVNKVLKEYES
jgi:hypothetical protein